MWSDSTLREANMKIFVSMPNDHQSNMYLINAFHDLGHDVLQIDHRSNTQWAVENVESIIKEFNPDIFLCLHLLDDQTYSADHINMLKVKFPHIKYAAWIFDVTIYGEYLHESKRFIDLVKVYDYVFSIDFTNVNKLAKTGVNAFHVPEGYCKYNHGSYKPAPESNFPRYDVAFIGQFGHNDVHDDRFELLDKICKFYPKTIVYGIGYQMTESIAKCYMRRPTYNDVEHCRTVYNSKINICHSGWPDFCCSARNYRISAAGGFMLANRGKAITKLWEEDKEIVLYSNNRECLDKIEYYINHDKERKAIALAGENRTLANYSFVDSISTMLKHMDMH